MGRYNIRSSGRVAFEHVLKPFEMWYSCLRSSGFSRGSSSQRYSYTNSTADTDGDDKTIERLCSLGSLGIVDDHDPNTVSELDERISDKICSTSKGLLKL